MDKVNEFEVMHYIIMSSSVLHVKMMSRYDICVKLSIIFIYAWKTRNPGQIQTQKLVCLRTFNNIKILFSGFLANMLAFGH